jgi:hypothetical protein
MMKPNKSGLNRQIARRVLTDCMNLARNVQLVYQLKTSEIIKALAMSYRHTGNKEIYMILFRTAVQIDRVERNREL